MAIDMGKLQHKESIMLPIIWEGCIKRHFQGIHHRFVNDPEFRASDIIWRKQNTFDKGRIGGSLSIMTEHLDDWKIVLTSTKRCPHYTIYTKNLENDNSGQCHSGSINTGTNHRVLPPVGGNRAILGGAHNNQMKVRTRATHKATYKATWQNGETCCLPSLDQTSDVRLSRFFLFCCSWIVYSWRRSTVTDGVCKDNTSQDRFRSVNLFKEFAYRSEIE